jgi:glycerol-3-phosphate dehydrogenase (NAD(P)+)
MKAVIIGDGAWGTALGLNLLKNGHEVVIWGAFPDYLDEMAAQRENFKFLPGVPLPAELQFCADPAEAINGASLAVLATPTQFLGSVLQKFGTVPFSRETVFVDVAKGIEVGSLRRISEMTHDYLGNDIKYAVLSGPSHAEEVSRNVPTLVTVASKDLDVAGSVQKWFMNESFRVYTTDDIVGVELGGALKNVFAVAAGVVDGMKLGDNPKAALMTRGVSELGRLGEALGGKRETLSGLAGIGDLIVTCTSGHSRNRHVGEELGRGRSLKDILKDMGMVVAEGVSTAESAYQLARKHNVETPLIDAIYAVLYQNLQVKDLLYELMTRAPKNEF